MAVELTVGQPAPSDALKWAAAGGALVGLLVVLSLAGPLITSQGPASPALGICGALPVGSLLPDGSRLTPSQAANAAIITEAATSAGAGEAGAVDAVDAAMTESRLNNVDYGTLGALGLFQETPADGWGSAAQVMDPGYATNAFLARLTAMPDWQAIPTAVAAQDVEQSAYPGRYQTWVGVAGQIVAGLSGIGACNNGTPALTGAATALPRGFALPAGTPAYVAGAISYAVAQLGKPYVWGGTGPDGFDCSGLVMMAYRSVGIDLPRTTYAQVYAGQPVYGAGQLAPGDLLFTEGSDPGPGGAPGHVGLYIGSGLVIDAPYTGHPIEVSPLSSWLSQLVAIRRVP